MELTAAPETVGEVLRRTRKQRGQELETVAEQLRIRSIHLNAIEENRYGELPGSTYAVGFIRSYAALLGLDSTEIVRRFKAQVDGLERQTRLVFPAPVPQGKVPAGAVILVSVVLVATAYGGWFYLSHDGENVAELVPEVPEQLQALVVPGEDHDKGATVAIDARAGAQIPTAEPYPVQAVESSVAELDVPGSGPDQQNPLAEGIDRFTDGENAKTTQLTEPTVHDTAPSVPPDAAPAVHQAVGQASASVQTKSEGQASVSATIVVAPAGNVGRPADEDELSGEATPAVVSAADLSDRSSIFVEELPLPPTESSRIPPVPTTSQVAFAPATIPPRVYGAENEDARIIVRATQDSWVQVRDNEDTLLLTRVLRPGDSYRVPNQSGLTLLTGNAGGIEIEIDGKTLPSLGQVGAVRRDVDLDPEVLLGRMSSAR